MQRTPSAARAVARWRPQTVIGFPFRATPLQVRTIVSRRCGVSSAHRPQLRPSRQQSVRFAVFGFVQRTALRRTRRSLARCASAQPRRGPGALLEPPRGPFVRRPAAVQIYVRDMVRAGGPGERCGEPLEFGTGANSVCSSWTVEYNSCNTSRDGTTSSTTRHECRQEAMAEIAREGCRHQSDGHQSDGQRARVFVAAGRG